MSTLTKKIIHVWHTIFIVCKYIFSFTKTSFTIKRFYFNQANIIGCRMYNPHVRLQRKFIHKIPTFNK